MGIVVEVSCTERLQYLVRCMHGRYGKQSKHLFILKLPVYHNKNHSDNSRIILSDVAFSGPVVTDTRIAQSPYYLVWPTRRQPHSVDYIFSRLSSVHVSTTDGQISFSGRTFLPSPTPGLVNPLLLSANPPKFPNHSSTYINTYLFNNTQEIRISTFWPELLPFHFA